MLALTYASRAAVSALVSCWGTVPSSVTGEAAPVLALSEYAPSLPGE